PPPTSPSSTPFPYTTLFRSHVHHHVPPKLTSEEMDHPNTWEIVLRHAQAKYGDSSEKAIALAAITLNKPLEEFASWVRVEEERIDRKSTRLNSSHSQISYAV